MNQNGSNLQLIDSQMSNVLNSKGYIGKKELQPDSNRMPMISSEFIIIIMIIIFLFIRALLY